MAWPRGFERFSVYFRSLILDLSACLALLKMRSLLGEAKLRNTDHQDLLSVERPVNNSSNIIIGCVDKPNW
ncbi:uncharacterized protein LY79DRAFT_70907 [Colletotrichum navitas]|uniref:Uncharacterized protein n=1 Tax=Colletotrichum navitas TaxID=681940 RepID=A0AAD8PKT2_9PEZI|nr:uncharacterized protein LY79DRAFT_70907 [Colletotrichum navitas]KAK1569668.1 hypothetical protein LY79DRAFT_70907 [Colletotrichum navitas]